MESMERKISGSYLAIVALGISAFEAVDRHLPLLGGGAFRLRLNTPYGGLFLGRSVPAEV
jgi:hypothetical protein